MPYDLIGKMLLGFGSIILLAGILFLVVGRFSPLGRLPGDINITNGNFTCIAPIATMLLLSLLLTLVVNVVARMFNR
ncbi:MAG: DUF2905 domain-containing protein [Chloroflexota bacterium]|nr:DUF2905 domain-containing protein [Chloroflexota bacterium]